MKWRFVVIYAIIFGASRIADAASSWQSQAQQDPQEKGLNVIASFADKICNIVPATTENQRVRVDGEIKAQLNGLLKQLADLGVTGSGGLISEKYGVLQKDLAEAIRDSSRCKLKVFADLQNKMIKQGEKSRNLNEITQNVFGEAALTTELSDFPQAIALPGGAQFTVHEQLASRFVQDNQKFDRSIYWRHDGPLIAIRYRLFTYSSVSSSTPRAALAASSNIGIAPPPPPPPAPHCPNTYLRQRYFALAEACGINPVITGVRGSNYSYITKFENVKMSFHHAERSGECEEDLDLEP